MNVLEVASSEQDGRSRSVSLEQGKNTYLIIETIVRRFSSRSEAEKAYAKLTTEPKGNREG